MSRMLEVVPTKSVEELRALAHGERDPRVRCRLLALAYVQAGHSAYEADELFGLTAVQIRQWIKRYNAEGIEGLSDRSRPGPRSRLAPAQYAAFLARLHAGPPPESGLSAWRGEDIRCLLAEEFGVDYSLSGVYALLHRLGQSSLVPRPSHPASDPAAVERAPEARRQRCWVHKSANVLNALPKSLQAKAKAQLHEIWMAPTRAAAVSAFERFVESYQAKYPKAADKLVRDRDALLAFYDFPAEHWIHLRTTNPIESTFATVRHRTTRTKNCVSRSSFLGLAFKLVQEAEKSWRRIRGVERIAELMGGVVFKDGEPVKEQGQEQQRLAA